MTFSTKARFLADPIGVDPISSSLMKATSLLQDNIRLGLSLMISGSVCMKPPLPALDSLYPGSSSLLRIFAHLESNFAVFGCTYSDSLISAIDCIELGSVLLLQQSARSEFTLSSAGLSWLDTSLSAADSTHSGPMPFKFLICECCRQDMTWQLGMK